MNEAVQFLETTISAVCARNSQDTISRHVVISDNGGVIRSEVVRNCSCYTCYNYKKRNEIVSRRNVHLVLRFFLHLNMDIHFNRDTIRILLDIRLATRSYRQVSRQFAD